MNTGRIEKEILLHAPLQRVWRALSDSREFGSWFGMKVDGAFEPGRRLDAVIVCTTVDPEIAAMQKAHQGTPFHLTVGRMDFERLFSFRWTHRLESGEEFPTLVEFTIEQRPEGVLLRVTESGFDAIPAENRSALFTQNEQGWAIQTRLIEKYLAANP
jgi:uncharacterized protein YndB with AHSA1/START domain